MSEKSRVIKAAGVIGTATLLSRVLGFVRDAMIAWFLGAGFSSDAFIAAFRIPNLLRRLLAEGSLSSAFIPVLTEYIVNNDRNAAFALARSAFRLFGLVLLIVTAVGILLSPGIVRVIAPGFNADKISLTVSLTRLMFPYLLCVGLMSLCMSILNVLGHFAAPAFAPLVLNLAIIGSIFFIAPVMTPPVIGLALGVLIGGILQFVLQLPSLVRNGFYFWQKAQLRHPALKKVGITILPIILGGAVYQINIVIGTLLGSTLSEGSVSYLYFADRLVQFPLGIFAIAVSTAVLPSLSRQAAARDYKGLKQTFAQALKLIFFISMPAMVGLIVLREPIVVLLFQRGEFDAVSARLTIEAVLYYSLGLSAFSAIRIVTAAFFAMQDARTPVLTAVLSIFAYIILGVILMQPMAHGGLALATSLASMLNLGLLAFRLRARLGAIGWRSIIKSGVKALFCSVVMGIAVRTIAGLLIPPENKTAVALLAGVAACTICGIFIYGALSYLLKSEELNSLATEVMKGIGK